MPAPSKADSLRIVDEAVDVSAYARDLVVFPATPAQRRVTTAQIRAKALELARLCDDFDRQTQKAA
jgi:hypothetical protein